MEGSRLKAKGGRLASCRAALFLALQSFRVRGNPLPALVESGLYQESASRIGTAAPAGG